MVDRRIIADIKYHLAQLFEQITTRVNLSFCCKFRSVSSIFSKCNSTFAFAIGSKVFYYKNQTDKIIIRIVKYAKNYITLFIIIFQFRCCGYNGPEDAKKSLLGEYPWSCCRNINDDCFVPTYTEGCSTKVKDVLTTLFITVNILKIIATIIHVSVHIFFKISFRNFQ